MFSSPVAVSDHEVAVNIHRQWGRRGEAVSGLVLTGQKIFP